MIPALERRLAQSSTVEDLTNWVEKFSINAPYFSIINTTPFSIVGPNLKPIS